MFGLFFEKFTLGALMRRAMMAVVAGVIIASALGPVPEAQASNFVRWLCDAEAENQSMGATEGCDVAERRCRQNPKGQPLISWNPVCVEDCSLEFAGQGGHQNAGDAERIRQAPKTCARICQKAAEYCGWKIS